MNIMRSIEGWEYIATPRIIHPYKNQKYFKRTAGELLPTLGSDVDGDTIF